MCMVYFVECVVVVFVSVGSEESVLEKRGKGRGEGQKSHRQEFITLLRSFGKALSRTFRAGWGGEEEESWSRDGQ